MRGETTDIQAGHDRAALSAVCGIDAVFDTAAFHPHPGPLPQGRGRQSVARRASAAFFAALLLAAPAFAAPAPSAEIHSNGTGGGRWSDPAAWHAQTPPGPNDTVVISRGDSIAFDRDDIDKPTCKDLLLDPGATLTFKTGGGHMTLAVAGSIESYGAIRIDTSQRTSDFAELRLVSPDPAKRAIKLLKGSSLVVSGAENLPGKRRNVLIASAPAAPPAGAPAAPDVTASLEAGAGTMVDLRQTEFSGLVLRVSNIDNTGAKPAERANFVGNRFVNLSRLLLTGCDTLRIADNQFLHEAKGQNPNPALSLSGCPLTEVKGNLFKGDFERAISAGAQVDGSILGNTFDSNHYGIVWEGPNLMVKGNLFRNCTYGLSLNCVGASIEDTVIDSPRLLGVYSAAAGPVQLVNVNVTNMPKEAVALDLVNSAQAQLLNCGFGADKIRIPAKPNRKDVAGKPDPWAEGQAYLFVNVKGTLPAGAELEVVTANPPAPLPPGAADLNIRNTPAKLIKGWTAPPASPDCLVVRTWRIGGDGTVEPTPVYTLRVLGPYPSSKPDAVQPVLKAVNVTPADTWYRPRPNDAAPTLEVAVP